MSYTAKYDVSNKIFIKHAKGFTLIEVVVSLLILAVILTSSMRLFSSAVHSEQAIRDKTLANWVAQNHAVQLQIDDAWPALGDNQTETTMGGIVWVIATNTATTADENFRKIDIKVYKEKQTDEHVAQIFTYSAKDVRW